MIILKQILNSKITLYILLGLFAFLLFTQYKSNVEHKKALEAANKVQDAQFEELKKSNELKFDSIAKLIHYQNEHLADLDAAYTDLIGMYDILNDKSNEHKDRIRNIRDVDSLRNEVANRYLRR